MHSTMFLPQIRCYAQCIWFCKSRFVYTTIQRELLCNKSSIQWRGEPGARESPRPRIFIIAICVYWGPLTCLFQPAMLPAIDCQGAPIWYFLKVALSKVCKCDPSGTSQMGVGGSFSPSNWGWKPGKHNIRQTSANSIFFFLTCLLNKNRSIYARHLYVTFHCRLLCANKLYALNKLKPPLNAGLKIFFSLIHKSEGG